MQLYCTRPGCPRPANQFPDMDDPAILRTARQKFCMACGMPLILAGHYVPQKLLGQGGFGAAFLACDRDTQSLRQAVLKQFQPSSNLTPGQLQMAKELFDREGKALEELGNVHPQIPDSYAFFELTVPSLPPGKEDKFFYLAQEYIDGQTMEEELAQKGAFSKDEVMEMLQAILPVLTFIHDQGFIHRDIKPSNIMRDRTGVFYLLDFGAVKQATKGGSASRSTGIYSLGFAPPEQMSGGEVYPSTDLYALAVTCIMLLTGKLPNELFDSYSNTWKWRNYAANVPDPLAAVLDRMLLPTPSQRLLTAADVLTAFRQPASVRRQGRPSVLPKTPPQPVAPTTLPSPAAAVSTPPAASAQLQKQSKASRPVSIIKLLSSAAFTGFEGGLLAIGLASLLGTSLMTAGFWLLLLAGLITAQSLRMVERLEQIVLAGSTLLAVLFFSPLRAIIVTGNPFISVLSIAVFAALAAISITTLFRLIYQILSRFL
jgi:serine/threonine protein kinase